jgi:hypothetical protein
MNRKGGNKGPRGRYLPRAYPGKLSAACQKTQHPSCYSLNCVCPCHPIYKQPREEK